MIGELKTKIQKFIDEQMKIKETNAQLLNQLFKQLENIKELELIESRLPVQYLNAYLTFKQAQYSNFQTEHLEQAKFDKEGYLKRLDRGIDLIKGQLKERLARDLFNLVHLDEINLDELIKQLQLIRSEKLQR